MVATNGSFSLSPDAHTDFYEPIFADPVNRALFFIPSLVTQTLGNFMLLSLVRLIQENQFANIQEHLHVTLCQLVAVVNIILHNTIFPRYLLGPFPEWVCAGLNIGVFGFLICTLLILNEIHLFRLLFASVWKNVGMLDDAFVMFFLKIANIFFSLAYCLVLYTTNSMPTRAHYLLCLGVSNEAYEKDLEEQGPLAVRTRADPGSRFFFWAQTCSMIFWIFVMVRMRREKRVLEDIQNRARDGNGLPRLYSDHPGIANITKPIVFYGVMLSSIALQGGLEVLLNKGLLHTSQFVHLHPIAMTFPSMFGSVTFPLLTMHKNERYWKAFKRKISGYISKAFGLDFSL